MGSQNKIADVFHRAGNLFVEWFGDFVPASCSLELFNSSYFYLFIALLGISVFINAKMLQEKEKVLLRRTSIAVSTLP